MYSLEDWEVVAECNDGDNNPTVWARIINHENMENIVGLHLMGKIIL